jgi:hypothetical protein
MTTSTKMTMWLSSPPNLRVLTLPRPPRAHPLSSPLRKTSSLSPLRERQRCRVSRESTEEEEVEGEATEVTDLREGVGAKEEETVVVIEVVIEVAEEAEDVTIIDLPDKRGLLKSPAF